MRRWVAAIAVALLSPPVVERAYAAQSIPPTPGLCVKTVVVHHDIATACRAVVGGRLFVFYFVRHRGVWFLLAARPASTLPSTPPS